MRGLSALWRSLLRGGGARSSSMEPLEGRQLLSAVAPDLGFGADGFARFGVDGQQDLGRAVAVQADGSRRGRPHVNSSWSGARL